MKRIARRLTGESLMTCLINGLAMFTKFEDNVDPRRIRMRMKSRSTIASFSRWIESVEEIVPIDNF